jgi:CRP-like cAMP-binding protein
MNTDQLFSAMKSVAPEFTMGQFEEMIPLLTESFVKHGDYLRTPGKNLRQFNFLVQGTARMFFRKKNGVECNIRLVMENDFIQDYESLLLNKPSNFFIQAIDDCQFIHIDYDQLESLFCSSQKWEHIARMINQYVLLDISRRALSHITLSHEEQYINLLEENPLLISRFSLEHIAAYLGIKRESLSRIRHRISKRF